MTKQLRLAVGELTDVGRRRERNQDNVTHFVPADADLLTRRGALFVVCDGMGGHAAGEIASEIGVRTIRETYFQESDEDVVTALARAIRAANTAIYEHAREHLTHSGMGTTCVALALVGGRGFFANIGDSRAYILRGGTLRQVTLDHSWVAEQVRAGILTEAQARVHAHRNVITRSLGTQPDVTADLFIEDMHEADRVLLCSDGLHGYVVESEIQHAIEEHEPEPSVRHLIDMANANGGPDNITAVVVNLLEVPAITDELILPDTIKLPRDVPPDNEITIPDAAPEPVPAPERVPVAASVSGAAPSRPRSAAPSVPAAMRMRMLGRQPGVWPVVALRLLAVAALCLISLGIWDVAAGPYAVGRDANAQALHDVASAQSTARTAQTLDPSTALNSLANAQQRLRQDLISLPLDKQGRATVQHALDTVIAPAVRDVLLTYNQHYQIATLPISSITKYTVACGAAALASGSEELVAVGPSAPPAGQAAAPVTLYALSGEGALYQITLDATTATATCGAAPVVAQGVKALASDRDQLYALTQQSGGWAVLQVGAAAKTTPKITLSAGPSDRPVALAAHGGDFYVAFEGASQGGSGIWYYGGTDLKKPAQTIAMPTGIAALGAVASGGPFALLLDGSLVRWDGAGHVIAMPVTLAPPIVTADPTAYAASTPVPTLPPGSSAPATSGSAATATPTTATPTTQPVGSSLAPNSTTTPASTASLPAATVPAPVATPTPSGVSSQLVPGAPTLFGGSSSLSADRVASNDLFVGDGATSRVVRFTLNGPDLQLVRQYVYGPPLSPLQSVTAAADGTRLFAWSGSQLVEVALPG